jgi:hypothetical protein
MNAHNYAGLSFPAGLQVTNIMGNSKFLLNTFLRHRQSEGRKGLNSLLHNINIFVPILKYGDDMNLLVGYCATAETTPWPSVRWRTILAEWPPLVGEVSAKCCELRSVGWSAQRVPMTVNFVFYFTFK